MEKSNEGKWLTIIGEKNCDTKVNVKTSDEQKVRWRFFTQQFGEFGYSRKTEISEDDININKIRYFGDNYVIDYDRMSENHEALIYFEKDSDEEFTIPKFWIKIYKDKDRKTNLLCGEFKENEWKSRRNQLGRACYYPARTCCDTRLLEIAKACLDKKGYSDLQDILDEKIKTANDEIKRYAEIREKISREENLTREDYDFVFAAELIDFNEKKSIPRRVIDPIETYYSIDLPDIRDYETAIYILKKYIHCFRGQGSILYIDDNLFKNTNFLLKISEIDPELLLKSLRYRIKLEKKQNFPFFPLFKDIVKKAIKKNFWLYDTCPHAIKNDNEIVLCTKEVIIQDLLYYRNSENFLSQLAEFLINNSRLKNEIVGTKNYSKSRLISELSCIAKRLYISQCIEEYTKDAELNGSVNTSKRRILELRYRENNK